MPERANPTRARAALPRKFSRMLRTGKPHARELHQVSDFGHVIVHRGKPHAHASCTVFPRWQCFHFGLQANPTRARAAQRIPEVATFPLRGKPHARESCNQFSQNRSFWYQRRQTPRARAAPFSFRKFFLKLRGQTLRARELQRY